jgi:hypothetical protein
VARRLWGVGTGSLASFTAVQIQRILTVSTCWSGPQCIPVVSEFSVVRGAGSEMRDGRK